MNHWEKLEDFIVREPSTVARLLEQYFPRFGGICSGNFCSIMFCHSVDDCKRELNRFLKTDKRISAIKLVRDCHADITLKESKDWIDGKVTYV